MLYMQFNLMMHRMCALFHSYTVVAYVLKCCIVQQTDCADTIAVLHSEQKQIVL